MKRFTVELPDEYDDAVSITAVGQTMGVAHVRTNVTVQAADLTGHDGETLVIRPHERPEWRKPETGWIPVPERLPDDSGYYLLIHYGRVSMIRFEADFKEFGYWEDNITPDREWNRIEGATHWMPLPEPPEGV